MENTRTLIRVQNSEDGDRVVACLHIHPTLDCNHRPLFYGSTAGEAAGKVLAWMIDNGISTNLLEITVH